MLIEFCVLDRNDGVDQIARELLVRNGLTVLDVDLAKDFVVSIQNHAGRFHLLEPVQIEGGRLVLQIAQTHRDINGEAAKDESRDCDRHVKLRPCIPPRPEPIARRRDRILVSRGISQSGGGSNLGQSVDDSTI